MAGEYRDDHSAALEQLGALRREYAALRRARGGTFGRGARVVLVGAAALGAALGAAAARAYWSVTRQTVEWYQPACAPCPACDPTPVAGAAAAPDAGPP